MKIKHLLLLPTFCLLALGLQAQTEKGKWLIGATSQNLGFFSTKAHTALDLNLSPSVGYFVMDNLALGVTVGNTLSYHKYTGGNRSSFFNLFSGANARYYFGLSPRLKLPVSLSAGYSRSWYNESGPQQQFGSLATSTSAGLTYFVTKSVGLNANLGYGFTANSSSGTLRSLGSIFLGVGFSIHLGKNAASE